MEQELVTLSPQNRDRLLAATLDRIRHRQAEAPAILARLRQLNPALADHFHAKQNALSDLTLRMLCPQRPASGTVPSFIAISYCWHHDDYWPLAAAARPLYPCWEISKPMVDAIMNLPDLRASPDEGVWLDKLCINQGDEAEKAVAIGAMDVIYRAARRIIILLEDVQMDADEEAAGLAYSGFYADMDAEVKALGFEGAEKSDFVDSYFPARVAALPADERMRIKTASMPFARKLLGARWFSRAWCAHESRVVPHGKTDNPLFLCFGSDGRVLAFEFRFIHYFSLCLLDSDPDPAVASENYFGYLNDPNPQTLRQRWSRIHRLLGNPDAANIAPTQHMVSIMPFGCLKVQDMVSITLNTAGIPLAYSGKIDSKGDFVWVFAAVAIAAGDAMPLLLTGRKLRIPDAVGGQRMTVSWMTDPISGIVDDKQPSSLVSSITGVTREYIELDLLVMIDRPLMASKASLEKAATMLEMHSGSEPAEPKSARIISLMSDAMLRSRGDRPGGTMETFRQTFLALALDCGIDWIRRFPDIISADTKGPETWMYGRLGEEQNSGLAAAASELLSHFNITEEDSRRREYMVQAIRFFTCLMDDRLKFLTLMPRRIQAATDDWGITASPSNRSWLAVPVALASQPLWQKRAWVVEPFDPDAEPERPEEHLPDPVLAASPDCLAEDAFPVLTSDYADRRAGRDDSRASWRLRRRQEIFGCRPIEASSSVLFLTRQKVYGSEDYDWAEIMRVSQVAEANHAPQ